MLFDKVLTTVIASFMALFSITATIPEGTEMPQITEKTYTASVENVRPIGRTVFDNDLLWCAYSGTGAEFTFNGTKASVTIQGDSSATGTGNNARVAIYVNGERVIDDMLNKAEETYEVYESTLPLNTTVKIVKLSETAMSTLAIKNITVSSAGDIKPTENNEHLIEFVGDSITCGYGVDDENRNHHFSTTTEDVTKTYAYKTAEALNADYSMVSISGYGIITGYCSDGKTKTDQILPNYYDKIGFSWSNTDITSRDWSFKNNRHPDVVVINLGTNDDSYCKSYADRKDEFSKAYVKFLKSVRKNNPDAAIICSLGIMGDNLYSSVEEAMTSYSKKTGDNNVYCLHFSTQNGTTGYAADWHPTEATHTIAAEELVKEIKEIMKW